MNPFEMVVLIVAIVMAAVVMKARYRSLGGTASEADPAVREDHACLQSELRALKDRVATLERIATDGASALDREIEALRERH